MNDKGMLKKGEQPLRAIRLKREYEKDPENCILMLLTLGSYLNKNGQLDKNAIIEALQSYYPEGTDREEVWRKCSESLLRFIDEVSFPREVVSGPILYRFNTALAMQTSLDPKTMRSVYTLSPYIKDRIYDKEFMRQYEFMRRNIADEKRKEEDKSKS
jgi:hypothetical protein